jgi:hypothetical protein
MPFQVHHPELHISQYESPKKSVKPETVAVWKEPAGDISAA